MGEPVHVHRRAIAEPDSDAAPEPGADAAAKPSADGKPGADCAAELGAKYLILPDARANYILPLFAGPVDDLRYTLLPDVLDD